MKPTLEALEVSGGVDQSRGRIRASSHGPTQISGWWFGTMGFYDFLNVSAPFWPNRLGPGGQVPTYYPTESK